MQIPWKITICTLKYNHNFNNMQVKLNVPKTKAKFWPPLQDIHCHGNHLSFGKALRLEKHTKKKHILKFFGESPMKKTRINMGKPPQKKKKKTIFGDSLGRAPSRKTKNGRTEKNIGKKKSWLEWFGAFSQKNLWKPKKNWRLFGEGPMEKTKKIGETKKRWKNIFWDYWLTLPKTSVFFCFGFSTFFLFFQSFLFFPDLFVFFLWGPPQRVSKYSFFFQWFFVFRLRKTRLTTSTAKIAVVLLYWELLCLRFLLVLALLREHLPWHLILWIWCRSLLQNC